MNLVEQYLRSVGEIHRSMSAVAETSYYPPLEALLNEVGRTLDPKVRCIINLRNAGAGIPDGGMFAHDQLKKGSKSQDGEVQIPERGAIEVKPPSEKARQVIVTDQGKRYLARYGLVLVTTLREFVLFECGSDGAAVEIESYQIASSADSFWQLTDFPRQAATKHIVLLPEFLRRVLTRKTRLSEPADVAWFLASYARHAKTVIEWKELATLASVRSSLEEVLGLKFEGEKGDHFFKSTLVQTLFYGLFASWVLWSKKAGRAEGVKFDWRSAQWDLSIPMIRALFAQVANVEQLSQDDMKDLVEPLDRATDTLNRVDRDIFFKRFAQSDAVQYFYEPFLQAFDPDLRKDLGVWYTPPEIVRYMVERVDVVLRSELGIEDGLADPRVYVLDPCCGTGAFLLEVLRRIERTLKDKGDDALVAQDVKAAARERVFGFEIMPAPFVVSHLQLGLMLDSLGAPLNSKANERVGVYLTNSLTGWESVRKPKDILFMELEAERDAAEDVKRSKPILVIIGNPPYNAFAGVSPAEEEGLVEPYKDGLVTEWKIRKFNLDELYVRFFRIAEQRIVEKTGEGIVCFISSFSYLSEASFVVMRQKLLQGFGHIWIDCLNGDSRETGKRTPGGKPDPSVFSTNHNPEGIKVGTAIGLFARPPMACAKGNLPAIKFREFWGTHKRRDLLESLSSNDHRFAYEIASPKLANRFSFVPSSVSAAYQAWPKLVDLSAIEPITGYKENRGFSLMDDDRTTLIGRMKKYYDPTVEWDELHGLGTGLTRNAARFDARAARKKVLETEAYSDARVLPYLLRPFETRWCYYCAVRPLWNEPRPSLFMHQTPGNGFLVSRPSGVVSPEGVPFYFTRELADFDFVRGHSYHFPIGLRSVSKDKRHKDQTHAFAGDIAPGLSLAALEYLRSTGSLEGIATLEDAEGLWMHVLAIGYSPAYLAEHLDGIRQDWPRIPMPQGSAALQASARLGASVAALLDTQIPINHVDVGVLRPELKVIGVLARLEGAVDPNAGHLNVEVGWGHEGKEGVTMPGKGKLVERNYSDTERTAIIGGAGALGLSDAQAFEALGDKTCDVYLNDSTYWRNVPRNVWDYVIGGYQVCKKWLSYRESDLLGRSLTIDEARYVTNMVKRLAALALLQPALDENYRRSAGATYAWPTTSDATGGLKAIPESSRP